MDTLSAATDIDTHHPRLAASATLGVTRLAVTDTDRAVPFYEQVLGLQQLDARNGVVQLGVDGVVVLELAVEPDARPAGRHAGLFHVALLYPSRVELARVGARIMSAGIAISGASDHGTHEAFYLTDPDGNGIELAADRPGAHWPEPGDDGAGMRPLDVDGLMSLVEGEPVAPIAAPGLVVGHLHLHVGEIEGALAFYRDIVGLELKMRMPTAVFLAVGDYHHHLGLNVWKGHGVPPAPDDTRGLRFWTIDVPRTRDVYDLVARLQRVGVDHALHGPQTVELSDPWNNMMRVEVASAAR